ncbi:MAG TPA: hypothetical protein VHX64_01900 [Caulobacteraceae bacterium]|jgi:hypothetical protein|nr:hypothetical protein [Caulobacteraceae bacterium]HEX4095447.1 hypothetical protein [Caulobacteraceae bacterium]
MDSADRKRTGALGTAVDPAGSGKRPWTSPKVILSDPMSSARQDNKGISNIPDQKFSSTSTS